MKIYYKPTCITCKKTISELERMEVDFEKRDFFKDKLSEGEIKKILKLSGLSAKELVRKRDKMYKELEIDESTPESKLIKFMVKYPGLIRRPIVFSKNKILVGKVQKKDL